jgi:hypothetical protein
MQPASSSNGGNSSRHSGSSSEIEAAPQQRRHRHGSRSGSGSRQLVLSGTAACCLGVCCHAPGLEVDWHMLGEAHNLGCCPWSALLILMLVTHSSASPLTPG